MKTWEMIKELTENPHKKFIAKYFKDEYFAYTRESMDCEEETYYDAIVLETEGEVWPLVVDEFTKGLEWGEVKEPVDFMTAYMAFEEDGKIVVWLPDNYPHSPKKRFDGKTQNRDDFEVTGVEIMTGKWYIED